MSPSEGDAQPRQGDEAVRDAEQSADVASGASAQLLRADMVGLLELVAAASNRKERRRRQQITVAMLSATVVLLAVELAGLGVVAGLLAIYGELARFGLLPRMGGPFGPSEPP